MAKTKIAVITCYKDPDYVRARTIRAALNKIENVNPIIVKNKRRGILRYPEMWWKLIQLRRKVNPDIYLLTFRGQEILPLLLLVAGKKPVIFDEFIVPLAWATEENHLPTAKNRFMGRLARMSSVFYRYWLSSCRFILTDTEVHAENSARLSGVNSRQYRVLPVGTDETIFKPGPRPNKKEDEPFKVFFYGSMLPLHGLRTVIDAAMILKDSNIEFVIVGGGKPASRLVNEFAVEGAKLVYHKWVPFEELPSVIYSADLCLGGPFGDTPQGQQVITGKTFQFLACGAPTLIGKNEASEMFKDKVNSLVVPQADPEALAKAVLWASKNPSDLKAIAAKGRRLYETDFSSEVITRDLKTLLSEVS